MSTLLRHYGFRHHPFARHTPKEALLRHRGFEEALDRLRFAVELDAIALLVAESGCGKSLLLGQLADELQREGFAITYFAHSTTGPFGLVNALARKAGLAPKRSRSETATLLGEHLLQLLARQLHQGIRRGIPEGVQGGLLPGVVAKDVGAVVRADGFEIHGPSLTNTHERRMASAGALLGLDTFQAL